MAGSSQGEASAHAAISIANTVTEIATATDNEALNSFLSNFGGTKERRETVLASMLEGGQDPLTILTPQANTLGYLYILSARFSLPDAQLPPLQTVQVFCCSFVPEHARLAPDRSGSKDLMASEAHHADSKTIVTMFARGLVGELERTGNLSQSIPLLFELLKRYPPSLHHLTTIHPLFARVCVATRQYAAALPVLEIPITEVDMTLSDLHYNDNLVYHYSAGMTFTALRRWEEAEDSFDIVAGSPAQVPSAIQLEALKKLSLIQLILYGKLPKKSRYISPTLLSIFMKSPYGAFINDFPSQTRRMESLLEDKAQTFESDKNTALVRLAYSCARRWSVKKLTETYVTLTLKEIGNAIEISDLSAVRGLVNDMLESKEIYGTILPDGTVEFHDPPTSLSKERIDALLTTAQQKSAILVDLDKKLTLSRDFLSKSHKMRDREDWNHAADEDMFRSDGKQGDWVDE